MAEDESRQLEQYLVELAQCEQQMDKAEREAELYRLKNTQTIYKTRRDILAKIPQFWYIVLAENDDFADYLSAEDLQFLETIVNLYVEYKVEDPEHYKDFTITIQFKGDNITEQSITKKFRTVIEDGEEHLESEPVDVLWPSSLEKINPQSIKKAAKGNMNDEQKKQYRAGMKSFFSWFSWTGKKPGKEFRSGEEFTRLIVEDIYPYAVKYYTEAMPGDDDDEDLEDSEEGEELDISDDESPKKKQKV